MPSDFEREYKKYIESETPDLWSRIEAGIEAVDTKTVNENATGQVFAEVAETAAEGQAVNTDENRNDAGSYVNQNSSKVIRWGVFAKRAGQIAAAVALVFVAYALVQLLAKGGIRSSESAAPMADAAPAADSGVAYEAAAEAADTYDMAEAADDSAAYEDEAYEAADEAPAMAEAAQAPVSSDASEADLSADNSIREAEKYGKNSLKAESGAAASFEAADGDISMKEGTEMILMIGDKEIGVEWEDNDSVRALKDMAAEGPLTIDMSMYGGFEQVGSLGLSLPSDDERIETESGDIVLYSGDQLVVFYGSNTWSYTRLGRITGLSDKEIEKLLSEGDVSITLTVE